MNRLFQIDNNYWKQIKDGNICARKLYERHYSCRRYKDGRRPKLFCGPGEKIVLLSIDEKALFVWRKFKSMNGQKGINCAIFRNESQILSSLLIKQAEEIAWKRWPGERLYTYVNPRKIKSKNPGCCFKKAGWKFAGITKKKLLIFEKCLEKNN